MPRESYLTGSGNPLEQFREDAAVSGTHKFHVGTLITSHHTRDSRDQSQADVGEKLRVSGGGGVADELS